MSFECHSSITVLVYHRSFISWKSLIRGKSQILSLKVAMAKVRGLNFLPKELARLVDNSDMVMLIMVGYRVITRFRTVFNGSVS
ncbi:hypothetical protein CIPAW_03G184400 [Carya illinoinensis]|uniref:Uncharacterized protein n=1 Tax=Carya illinoinensis TaxID=32201 RepID=A0A8T1R3V6_CARIL|nr:hypothetical protein CIPAW_03G184400 [Carya illinoinensis]